MLYRHLIWDKYEKKVLSDDAYKQLLLSCGIVEAGFELIIIY
jgi:hypothetical protein